MALPNFINTIAPEPSLARWASLINNQPVPFPVVFYGDTKDMSWYFHNNGTIEAFSGGSGYTLRVTLGNVDAGPTGGNYTLTCGETTAALSWDADAETVAGALNSLPTVIAFGGVNVSGVFPNFQIYSNEIGAVTAITADDSLLSPDSTITASVLTTGGVTARQQTLVALRRGLITQQTNWTQVTGPAGWTGSLEMSGEAAAAILAEFGEVVGGYLQVQTQLTAEVIKNSNSAVTAYYQTTVLFRGKNSDFTGVITPPSPPYTLGDILYGNALGGLSKLPGNTSATLKVLSQTGDGVASAVPAWIDPDTQGVTSVGLSLPSDLFTVSGSPVTSTGTLTGTLKTQVKNTIWAGPATGVDASPAFRTLVSADLPALTTGSFVLTGNGTGGFTNTDLTYSTPTLSVPDAFNISGAGSIKFTPAAANFVSVVGSGVRLDGTAASLAAWGTTAPGYSTLARTYTDTSSATGQVQTITTFNSLGIPSLNATNASVTYDTLAGLYLGGDPAVTGNASLTANTGMSVALYNAGKSRFADTIYLYQFGTTKAMSMRRAQGSITSPTILVNGNSIGGFSFEGFNGTSFTQVGNITAAASENWSAGSSYGTDLIFSTTNTGVTTVAEAFRIKNNGSLILSTRSTSLAAWGLNGATFRDNATTGNMLYTDTSSATGTVANAVAYRFSNPIIDATNASVVYTDIATVYIAGDMRTQGNASGTNKYGLWNVGKTRNDGNQLQTGTTLIQFGATALGNIGVSADTTAGILQIKSPTSGTITLTTANALGLTVSGGASCVLTGGAGNMTIIGGTGASRTLTLQTTTSGGTATNALVLSSTQNATFGGSITTSTPNGGTAGAWKLGILVTTASIFDTTRYIQLDVGGTLFKLALCT